jgi:YgiT-type zinc finger domain-containing protein
MSESPHRNEAFPCRECQAGMMRLRHVTYFTWLDEEVITVPNFPAWVCDVCGRREYDEKAVNWLSTLLNPDAGHSTSQRRRSGKRPSTKRDATGVIPEQ